MQIIHSWHRLWLSIPLIVTLSFSSGCGVLTSERVTYESHGIRIGVEPDPTVARSSAQAGNAHPATLSAADIHALLQVVQVSGWSGTLAGILTTPPPIPLFSAKELSVIADALAAAFRTATPTERVFFSLPKPDVAYSEERTVGSLFLRGRYLHVVVMDHSAFLQADTAGGDLRDIRDTKGMKLWVSPPAQAATVPDLEEPQWAPFETVHVSVKVADVLAPRSKSVPVTGARETTAVPATVPGSVPATAQPSDDLHLQIRELTSSNLDLRKRLEEQTARMKELTQQLEQLRLELDSAKSKKPAPRKSPTH